MRSMREDNVGMEKLVREFSARGSVIAEGRGFEKPGEKGFFFLKKKKQKEKKQERKKEENEDRFFTPIFPLDFLKKRLT